MGLLEITGDYQKTNALATCDYVAVELVLRSILHITSVVNINVPLKALNMQVVPTFAGDALLPNPDKFGMTPYHA